MALSKISETLASLSSLPNPITASTQAVLEGDLVVFVYKKRDFSTALDPKPVFSAGAGSTAVLGAVTRPINDFVHVSGRVSMAMAYARVTAGGDLIPSLTQNGSGTGVFGCVILRGVDPVTPVPDFDLFRLDGSTATDLAGNPVTPSAAGDMVLGFSAIMGDGSTYTPTATPAFTQVWAVAGDISSILEYYIVPDTADVTSHPTLSAANNYVTGNLVIRAAPAPILGETISRMAFL